MSAGRALICARGFGIAELLDGAAVLLPERLAWTIVHVVDQRPEAEMERAIAGLPGRRPHRTLAGVDRIQRSVDQLQDDVRRELEAWLQANRREAALEFLYGLPEHRIVELANALPAEVVVVGARPGIGPHRFGHVNRFVIDHAACSVLVVAPREPDPDLS